MQPIPPVLYVLGIIALVLHILFSYLIVEPNPPQRYFRPLVAGIVIILILLIMFILPIRVR